VLTGTVRKAPGKLEAIMTLEIPEAPRDSGVLVDIGKIIVAESPRIALENPEHIQLLAAYAGDLLPIIVHYETMCVIDGVHRLRAAQLNGQAQIPAIFFHGSAADAFVLSVKANIAHGLPLSLTERKRAGERIIRSHRHWSDRTIACAVGLAPGTVAAIRRRLIPAAGEDETRTGRDGRIRPRDGRTKREHAAQFMASNPGMSLRAVGRAIGISPETARSVRNSLQQGEGLAEPEDNAKPDARMASEQESARRARRDKIPPRLTGDSSRVILESLRSDPVLRYSANGRTLLRLLQLHLAEVKGWEAIVDSVPAHRCDALADLGRECMRIWADFTAQIERKAASLD
jgi:transposase-like protein